ncbi:MAG: MFS transporter [Bacteroidota bacterium]
MSISKQKSSNYFFPLMIVGIMYFAVGFGVGISGFLTPALKSAFDLSIGQSYLVTAAIFSAFVIFGGPSGWVIKKIGYKLSMMLAFFIMAIGMFLFVPSANAESFPIFLFALFVGGMGNTLLQASINPYVTLIGPIESTVMRMSLMGIMNKGAWWIAPLFLGFFIDLQDVKLDDIVFPFYIVTGIMIFLGVFTYFSKLPEVKAEGEENNEVVEEDSTTSYAYGKTSIMQFPHLLLGVVAIFIFVGIETLPMTSIIDFARATFGDNDPDLAGYSKYVSIGLILGYIFGALAIPKLISQTKALILFTLIGIGSTTLLVFSPAQYAFYALLFVSFSNSIMWGAIWPLAIEDLGKFTKKGSSLLVTGIVGGAVIPLIFGFLVDFIKGSAEIATVDNYQMAYLILYPCYLFLLYFAVSGHKIRR